MTTTEPTKVGGATGGRSRSWRGDIQGLRAVAVLLVVTFHAGLPVPGGFVGVDVFFVISGFVITALLTRELASSGRISFATFYTRRVRRLLPALGLMVTVTLIGSLLLQSPYGVLSSPQEVSAKTGIGAMLIVANAVLYATGGGYFALDADSNPLLHTWSLSVEEQFYLIFPLLLLIGWIIGRRRVHSRRSALVLVALLGAASFVLSYVMSYGIWSLPGISDPAGFAFYSSFTRAWEFAAGAGLALVVTRVARLPARLATPAGLGGAVLLVASGLALRDTQPFPGLVAVIPVVGTMLLIASGTMMQSNAASSFLATPPMVWLGDRSYSWYLWHWPFIVFAALLWPGRPWVLVAAAVVSLIPTWGTYRYYENAIRISPRFASRRRVVALASVVVIVPCLVGLVVLQSARTDGFGRLPAAPVAGWDADECNAAAVAGDLPEICQFPATDAAAPTAILIGDSHAAAMSSAFVGASVSAGFNATTSTFKQCNSAKVTQVVTVGGSPTPLRRDCAPYYAMTDEWMSRNPQDVVVVVNRSPFYATSDVRLFDDVVRRDRSCLEKDGRCLTGNAAIQHWTDSLTSEVERLVASGSKVIVVGTVPEHSTDGPAGTSLVTGVRAPGTDRSIVERRRAALVAAERKAISRIPGAVYVDPIDDFCTAVTCAQVFNGEFVYIDDDHLSVAGGRLFQERLQETMTDLAAG